MNFLDKDRIFSGKLSEHTTWKIGGPCDFFKPSTLLELQEFLANYQGLVSVLGYGSNVLAPSEGLKGICVILKKNFSDYKIEGSILTAQTGLSCPKLAKIASKKGFDALNFLIGIPGSLGGAIVMNAGAYGSCLMPFVQSLEIVDRTGKKRTYEKRELKWTYRQTILPHPGIITSVTLDLTGPGNLSLKEIMSARARTQPLAKPSCGSFFKNPTSQCPAGYLIEQLGAKGLTVGGAQVSHKHANFVLNCGQAQSDDILKITKILQNKAFLTTGYILKPEYKILTSLPVYENICSQNL